MSPEMCLFHTLAVYECRSHHVELLIYRVHKLGFIALMCLSYFELMRHIYFSINCELIVYISLKLIQYFCSVFIIMYCFALYADEINSAITHHLVELIITV